MMKQVAIFFAVFFCVQALYVVPEDKEINEALNAIKDLVRSFKTGEDSPDAQCPSDEEEGAEATLFPHPTDCTLYYECVWGSPILMECSPGLHFNPVLFTCDWPKEAGCNVAA